ncbi:uncharacterized protein MONOS_6157 [Monocercomonoides exilis]|uniref:uncharacterized protein n=1 Tax=Monocercomonoides exilis TaxID=2049356 RepID=UPI00355AC7E5|nr:hypothetical protein MONOS_6157 [Monocercomonoides exilis]|eukprot:MONOS_6157.1-p1 / transcript=MONOS_6157.1 / gene=MONOS_6157 / organism=Monocercomonoides_exilis_PA203 / gene_product=unspecified product / transcript_product=unspecified product / location=Mono_scaffold00190:37599-38199(-) / protein_length=179 / sequence_SO=supercontig / SO=protein_coding / is_pseudo=false
MNRMDMCDEDKFNDDVQELSFGGKFLRLFSELERCGEIEQKQKIGEMNEIIDGMNKVEWKSVFKAELFDEIHTMVKEKKMSMENAILLLKHAGYCKALKNVWSLGFNDSEMRRRFEKMIFEEAKKKEEEKEKLIIDLCECYISLSYDFPHESLSICMPCLLKVALNEEENEKLKRKRK